MHVPSERHREPDALARASSSTAIRLKSFGYVDRIESDVVGTLVYIVQWCDSKIASGPPERCLCEELIATTCDGCGQNLCWCGVGR